VGASLAVFERQQEASEIAKVVLAMTFAGCTNWNDNLSFTFSSPPDKQLSAIFFGFPRILREMPGIAPRAEIGAKVFRSVGRRDLMGSGVEGFAFTSVHSLATDGTF
jgi:hypothetical protein